MAEKKEEKQVKVNLSVTSEKLFTYGAIAAAIIGLLWGILAAVGMEGAPGSYRFALFLEGFFFAIFGSLVLYGLSQIIKSKQ
jgi:uncharacterized membrane protein